MNQIAFAVAGADTTVTMAADNGQLQLNAFEPVIAHVLLQSISWLEQGSRVLRRYCMEGIEANTGRLARQTAASVGLATALIPAIGYAAAAAVAKEALQDGSAILEIVTSRNLMDRDAAQLLLESAVLPVRTADLSGV
jgi:aspartate ammonia-lyase